MENALVLQEQKQMLGEHIFPLVQKLTVEGNAGKVTGMLLEMDIAELLQMYEDSTMLQAKVRRSFID